MLKGHFEKFGALLLLAILINMHFKTDVKKEKI